MGSTGGVSKDFGVTSLRKKVHGVLGCLVQFVTSHNQEKVAVSVYQIFTIFLRLLTH